MNLHGTIHGGSIQVEEPLPGLEGKRVRLRVELLDEEDAPLVARENRQAWEAWAASGPQGPLDDDEADWT